MKKVLKWVGIVIAALLVIGIAAFGAYWYNNMAHIR